MSKVTLYGANWCTPPKCFKKSTNTKKKNDIPDKTDLFEYVDCSDEQNKDIVVRRG